MKSPWRATNQIQPHSTPLRLATVSSVFSALLGCLFLLSSPAALVHAYHGYDETITIDPAAPTEDDLVRIRIDGYYFYMSYAGYWAPESASYSISGQTITIQELWTYVPGPCEDPEPGGYACDAGGRKGTCRTVSRLT